MADTPDTPPPDNAVTVLNTWAVYSDAPNAFYKSFVDEALPLLARRKAAVDRLVSRADWEQYRQEAKRKVAALMGTLPEKTPLNARVVGTVGKPAFRVEKVIYESRPGFPVTAALFVPAGLREAERLGRQLADLDRTIGFASARFGVKREELLGLAHGALGPLLLHAHAFGAFDRLAATAAPRRLLLADPRDGTGGVAGEPVIAVDTTVITQAYAAKAGQPQFHILRGGEKSALNQALEAWLK